MPNRKEKYFIFEYTSQTKLRGDQHFFSTEKYYNAKLTINELRLLHFKFDEHDLFLLFGKNKFEFSAGKEFVEFLINNGVDYLKFDVEKGPKEGDWNTDLKLKDGRIIRLESFAHGYAPGTNILQLNKEGGQNKVIAQYPKFKLRPVSEINASFILKWSGKQRASNFPTDFDPKKESEKLQEEVDKSSKRESGCQTVILLFTLILVLLIIYLSFF